MSEPTPSPSTALPGEPRQASPESGHTSPYVEGGSAAEFLSLPGYEILGELGRGGMGVVYKAWQRSLKRFVALKVLPPGTSDRMLVARFRAEAEAAAGLQHPNIVRVYEVGEYAGGPYFSLEYVEGTSLAERLARDPLPAPEAAALVETVSRAMQHAHEHGIVHRDLKPGNVLLAYPARSSRAEGGSRTEEQESPREAPPPGSRSLPPEWGPGSVGCAKVADFGLARQLDADDGLTCTGQVLGTPSYMAPEQASGGGKHAGPLVDVYSLGAVLYACLVGRPPFKGATMLDTLELVRSAAPVPPRQLQPSVPADLDTICLKCLEKDPGRRYASAAELADDLARFRAGEPIRARPEGAIRRARRAARRHPALATLLVALALAAAGGVAAGVAHNRRLGAELANTEQQREAAELQKTIAEGKERSRRRQQYIAEMNLALKAHEEGETGRVLELLARQVPGEGEEDLRGFDWHHLHAACHADRATLSGHRRIVAGVAISPDGKTLASVSGFAETRGEGELFLWSLPGGKAGKRVTTDEPFAHVAYSPDGTRLAALGFGGRARIYDPATLTEVKSWKLGLSAVGLAFTADGRELVSFGLFEKLRRGFQFWDVESGQPGRFFPVNEPVRVFGLSGDGGTLCFASSRTGLHRIDLKSGKALPALKGTAVGVATRLVVSANGELAAVSYVNGRVALWNLKGQTVRSWTAHAGSVGGLAFTGDDRRLVSTGDDRTVRVWLVARQEEERVIRGHRFGVHAVAVSRDGKTLVTGGGQWGEGEIKVWDFEVRDATALPQASGVLRSATFFAGSKELASLSITPAEEVRRWDAASGRLLGTTPFPDSRNVTCLGTASAAEALAVGDTQGRIALPGVPGPRQAHSSPVEAIAFTPDGSRYASAARDGLKVWETKSGRLLRARPSPGTVLRLQFSPDGRLLATGGEDGTIGVLDLSSEDGLRTWKGHGDMVLSLAFSSAGGRLASGGRDALVRVWDVASGDKESELPRQARPIRSLLFAPDGKTLISGDSGRRVKVWDLATAQERASYQGSANDILDLAFGPDGKTLLAAGGNHVVQRWSTVPRRQPE